MIVNYRTKELTCAAARSAVAEPEVREVVIVDNASGDGSVGFLRAALPEQSVRIVESGTNLGFGRAVNLVAPDLRGGLLLLLNSDATLVPGTVARLTEVLLADDAVAVVAPAVLEADGFSQQDAAYGAFPRLVPRPGRRRGGKVVDPTAPDWVSGVAMALRKDDFLAVGGFDPDFAMYLEDVDLCRRLRGRGGLIRRDPAAAVIHAGGRSWQSPAARSDHYHRSKIVYFKKHGATPVAVAYLHMLRLLRVSTIRMLSLRRSVGQ